jgi:hypothetical protein
MHEVWAAVFLVAVGGIVLLLALLITLRPLRRLSAARAALRREWADGVAALAELVNARDRRRDEREKGRWTSARRANTGSGAA